MRVCCVIALVVARSRITKAGALAHIRWPMRGARKLDSAVSRGESSVAAAYERAKWDDWVRWGAIGARGRVMRRSHGGVLDGD